MTTARVIANEYRRPDGTFSHTAVSLFEPHPHDDHGPLVCQVHAGEDLREKVLRTLGDGFSRVEIVRMRRHTLDD